MKKHKQPKGVPGKKYVAYMRVSTKDQDYGIEAQHEALLAYAPVAFYIDRVSGKRISNREQLNAALDHCKAIDGTLLFYKIDRLGRDVESIFQIKNSGIDLYCLEMPELNTFTLGMLATFAQHEREQISKRTKDGLAMARKNGKKIGATGHKVRTYKKFRENGKKSGGGKTVHRAAVRRHASLANAVYQLVAVDGLTFLEASMKLNQLGFKAPKGGTMFVTTVTRLFKYGQELEAERVKAAEASMV
jgi:DNA invertase Pin-like site-specific DNA recombinase